MGRTPSLPRLRCVIMTALPMGQRHACLHTATPGEPGRCCVTARVAARAPVRA
ncbi:hypothetical protein XCR_3359 [Xanthomonas campestris pv. raphani 756C]|nr:hypothetical protein XCR_3359 [Xanthomonas campestris pv. raphani 756C]